MLFSKKEKMKIEEFLAILTRDILQIKPNTYNDYLNADSMRILTEQEFDKINNQIIDLRILLIMSNFMNISNSIKVASRDAYRIFMSSLEWALKDNGYDKESEIRVMDAFKSNFTAFINYFQAQKSSDIDKNGFVFYACMFFSEKFIVTDVSKMGTYASLINNNKKIINEYFSKCYKGVKIIQ